MTSDLPQTQGKTLPDAWDYKGCPADRSKTGGWIAAAMILGTPQITLLLSLLIPLISLQYICN